MKMQIKFFILFLFLSLVSETKAIGFEMPDFACLEDEFTVTDTTTAPTGLSITSREWDYGDGTVTNSTINTATHKYGNKGQYTITLKITYSDGTVQTYSSPSPIEAVEKPQATCTVDYPITCPGVPINFTVGFTQGDGVITNYILDLGNGAVQNNINVNTQYAYLNLGSFQSVYKVIDQYGCTDSVVNNIRIIGAPKVSFKALDPSCKDSIVFLENTTTSKSQFTSWTWTFIDSGGITYQLNDSSVYKTWHNIGPQTVILEGTTIYNCKDTSVQLFNVDTTPVLTITPSIDTTICFGESVQYLIKGYPNPYFKDFIWGDTIKGDSVVLFTPKNTYTYYAYAKSPNCREKGYPIKIRVIQPIATNMAVQPTKILLGGQAEIKFYSNGIYDSIMWSPSASLVCPTCDSTLASPTATTTYTAKVFYGVDEFVCSTQDSITIEVSANCSVDSLNIPNAFTPNDDGLNDVFYMKSTALKNIESFKVYNRWGEQVFSKDDFAPNDESLGWNGKEKNNGDPMTSGMYIYHIVATCQNGQKLTFTGEINLLR